MATDKTTKAARDRDADRQLKEGRVTRHKGGASPRASAKPENAGLGQREIDALERENSGHIGGGKIAISGRAGRAQRGRR
jgi:hypothetical protein